MEQSPILPGYQQSFPEPQEPKEPVGALDAFTSGFLLENDVVNAYEYMSRPTFEPEEGYVNSTAVKEAGLWDNREYFVGVSSKAELDYRRQRLEEERRKRVNLMEGGWSGFFGALAGGALSPTMFIPLIGPEVKGAAAFRQALLLSSAGGVLQEIPLQLNQEDRTAMESFTSVLGQTVLGGILGGLAGGVRSAQFNRWASDMANLPDHTSIPRLGSDVDLRTRVLDESPVPEGHVRLFQAEGQETFTTNRVKSEPTPGAKEHYLDLPVDHPLVRQLDQADEVVVPKELAALRKLVPEVSGSDIASMEAAGAQVVFHPTEGLKRTWATKYTGVGKVNELVNPVAEVIEQSHLPDELKFYSARWMMQQLASGGMRMAENVKGETPTPGGTIENLKQVHYGKLYKGITEYDKAYQDYAFDGEATPSMLPNAQAKLKAWQGGKMNKKQFAQEVSRALRSNDEGINPHVTKAAKAIRKEILDPLLKEAQSVGIYDEVLDVIGDPSYLMRVYDPSLVVARMPELIRVLSKHYAGLLEDDWVKSFEKFKEQKAAADQFAKDAELSFEEASAMREKFLNDLKDKEVDRPAKSIIMEQRLLSVKGRLSDLRKQRRNTRDERTVEERQAGAHPLDTQIEKLRDEQKKLEELMPLESAEFAKMRSSYRKRITNLNKSLALKAGKRAGKIERLERISELNLNALNRLGKSLGKFYAQLDGLSDEALNAELEGLKGEFASVAAKYDKGEARIAELESENFGLADSIADLQDVRYESMTKLAQDIEEAGSLDRDLLRGYVEAARDMVSRKTQRMIEKRAVRAERLREDAAKLAPEKVQADITAQKAKFAERSDKFVERWRTKGLDNIGEALEGVAPDFADFATARATEVARAMANMTERLPVHDLIVGAHGPERARVLTIPSKEIEFVMENDAEKIVRIYMRTLAPDIEIARKFGDINASRILGEDGQLAQEYNARVQQLDKASKKNGKPFSKEEKERNQQKLAKDYKRIRDVLKATMDRLRHLRGIPENPDGFGYRAGRVVMNLNVLRYMGMTMISSVPDVKNLVLKHGLTRVMRDVFVPFITNFKNFQVTAREAFIAGQALDVLIHTRANQILDVGDDLRPHSTLERGVEYLTNRMGMVAGFDLWNREMKKISAVASTAHMMDDMKLVMEGGGSAKETQRAMEYLSSLGLGHSEIETIWKQVVATNGGNKVNGLWWPNTENWTDPNAVRYFRQALSGELDSTIVTPGLERSLWMDRNIGLRMIGQFRSFAFSSMSKSLMAGLQAPDMALLNSTMISLALGAFSYYLWALSAGGEAWDEANKFDPAKWADEAIARSGTLALGQDAWELAQRTPFIRDYSTFSGQQNSRRQGMDFVELFMGPSFDFASKSGSVLLNADQPTANTVHAFRQLLPWQNVYLLRQAFDKLEEALVAAGDLPDRRQ